MKIFFTKKAFDNAVCEQVAKAERERAREEAYWRLRGDVDKLTYEVQYLKRLHEPIVDTGSCCESKTCVPCESCE